MLYCLLKHKKLCLPFIIFQYLKESINKSRTTADEGKKILHYIPFGRILSHILVESGLVDALRAAQCTEDLVVSTGDILDDRNLKKMGVVESVVIQPVPETPQEALMKRFFVDGYPLFSKIEPPEVIAQYIFMMQQDGIDTSGFRFEDIPIAPADVYSKKKKKKKKRSEGEEPEKKKKSKKKKVEKAADLKSYSEASEQGTSAKPSTSISFSISSDAIPVSSSHTTQQIPTSNTYTHTSTQIPTPVPSAPI